MTSRAERHWGPEAPEILRRSPTRSEPFDDAFVDARFRAAFEMFGIDPVAPHRESMLLRALMLWAFPGCHPSDGHRRVGAPRKDDEDYRQLYLQVVAMEADAKARGSKASRRALIQANMRLLRTSSPVVARCGGTIRSIENAVRRGQSVEAAYQAGMMLARKFGRRALLSASTADPGT